jgi:hypothetical protein
MDVSACTYCGSDAEAHDQVVIEGVDDDASEMGRFCNDPCLTQYTEKEALASGACCRIDVYSATVRAWQSANGVEPPENGGVNCADVRAERPRSVQLLQDPRRIRVGQER